MHFSTFQVWLDFSTFKFLETVRMHFSTFRVWLDYSTLLATHFLTFRVWLEVSTFRVSDHANALFDFSSLTLLLDFSTLA